jgi:predicted PurR-regulated permease PerM
MLEMLGDIAIGLVLFVVGVLLVIIGIPRHGESPRFLRFEASLDPAVVMVFLAFGVAMMLRGYALS